MSFSSCMFSGIGSEVCGEAYRKSDIVFLKDLTTEVSAHLRKILLLPPGYTESDLICNRILPKMPNLLIKENPSLCPKHRFLYGLYWMKHDRAKCSYQGHDKLSTCYADRPVTYQIAHELLVKNGTVIPVGSMFCKNCMGEVMTENSFSEEDALNILSEERNKWLSFFPVKEICKRISKTDAEMKISGIFEEHSGTISAASSPMLSQFSAGFVPSQENLSIFNNNMKEICKLNDITWPPLDHQLNIPLKVASKSTTHHIIQAAAIAIQSVCDFIAPGQSEELFSAVHEKFVNENLSNGVIVDPQLKLLIDAFETVETTSEKIAVLSMFCEKYTLTQLLKLSPLMTKYLVDVARQHCREVGAGKQVVKQRFVRHRLSMPKVVHFFEWLIDWGFIQYSSWGKLSLKMSNGEVKEMGNVVLTACKAHLIQLYHQDCAASNNSPKLSPPLSERTLFKILETIKFSEQKCLSGLDNIAVNGNAGFDCLEKIIQDITMLGTEKHQMNKLKEALLISRNYLRSEYRLNVSASISECSQHCRLLALSDPKKKEFQAPCNHNHYISCKSCDLLSDTLTAISEVVLQTNMPESQRNDLIHDAEKSKETILEWKAHILRSMHQFQAKQRVIINLNEETGLVIFDWAMKYIPVKFREKQADWFGKKGISWHVAVLMTKENGEMVKRTYCTFIQDGVQDAATSACLYLYNLQEMKKDFPSLTKIYDKSDNAACYRNWIMLNVRRVAQEMVGIKIVETTNNDPQSGKDQADRDIAVIKSRLKQFASAGNNIETAADMKKAIDYCGGLVGVKTAVLASKARIISKQDDIKPKNVNITEFHSFKYETKGIRLWKFDQVGDGLLVPYSYHITKDTFENVLDVIEGYDSKVLVPKIMCSKQTSFEKKGIFYHCNEPECHKRFLSAERWEYHTIHEKHDYAKSKENTSDLIKNAWINVQDVLSKQHTAVERRVIETFEPANCIAKANETGWALKERKARTRLNENQQSFLEDIFWKGQTKDSHKAAPSDVALRMRIEMSGKKKRFQTKDYLSQQEIGRYFGVMAANAKKGKIRECQDSAINENNENVETVEEYQSDYEAKALAAFECETLNNLFEIEFNKLQLEIGSFCAIVSSGSWLPGKIINYDNETDEVKISLMSRQGESEQFTWPQSMEEIFVDSSKLLGILSAPKKKGKNYTFPKSETDTLRAISANYETPDSLPNQYPIKTGSDCISKKKRIKDNAVDSLVQKKKNKIDFAPSCKPKVPDRYCRYTDSSSEDDESKIFHTVLANVHSQTSFPNQQASEPVLQSCKTAESSQNVSNNTNQTSALVNDVEVENACTDEIKLEEKQLTTANKFDTDKLSIRSFEIKVEAQPRSVNDVITFHNDKSSEKATIPAKVSSPRRLMNSVRYAGNVLLHCFARTPMVPGYSSEDLGTDEEWKKWWHERQIQEAAQPKVKEIKPKVVYQEMSINENKIRGTDKKVAKEGPWAITGFAQQVYEMNKQFDNEVYRQRSVAAVPSNVTSHAQSWNARTWNARTWNDSQARVDALRSQMSVGIATSWRSNSKKHTQESPEKIATQERELSSRIDNIKRNGRQSVHRYDRMIAEQEHLSHRFEEINKNCIFSQQDELMQRLADVAKVRDESERMYLAAA